jgi:hypothetical protein
MPGASRNAPLQVVSCMCALASIDVNVMNNVRDYPQVAMSST